MLTTYNHPDLGQLKGRVVDGGIQFLGLKYASLQDRLAPPKLITSYGPATDATKFGPPPVSPLGAIQREFGFIQKSLPVPEVPDHSDLEGLNLNITIPLGKNGSVDSTTKHPIYVFVHGGGFAVGSSWYPHYDPAAIVKISSEIGKPIIGITINYRLGLTGFLTSKELRTAGYKANNGFHDQRTALKWIQKFISGFGGDPDEITVVGESAGGTAVTMLLTSEEPLMKRCLSTGGAVLLFKPIPAVVTEGTYRTVIKAFGLEKKTPEERIKGLLEVPIDDLWQKIPPGTPLQPCIDGDTVPGELSFSAVSSKEDDPSFTMPGRKWCASMMIGESKLDANIIAWLGLDGKNPGIASKFIEHTEKALSAHPDAASSLISSYDLTPETDDEEAMISILRFATEISFYAPALAFAKGWPKAEGHKFYLYHFNEGNPWEGRFKGEAGHILDVAFLFQNYNENMNDAQKALARAFAEDFIKYVSGEDPWPPVEEKMGARVYGPTSDGITTNYVDSGVPEDVGRNSRVLRLGEKVGFDVLLDLFGTFFMGK